MEKPPTREIYALIDPDSLRVRYIGQSVNAARRCNGHTAHTTGLPAVKRWLASLRGRKPILAILAIVPMQEAGAAETAAIAAHLDAGAPLLNVARRCAPSTTAGFRVRCAETGTVFRSYNEAGRAHGVCGSTVRNRCDDGTRCMSGVHFERL